LATAVEIGYGKLEHRRAMEVVMTDPRTIVFPTKLGWICLAIHGDRLCELTFGHESPQTAANSMRYYRQLPSHRVGSLKSWQERLQAFVRQPADDFRDVTLDLSGFTRFQRAIVEHCRQIRIGETISYAELARRAGSPKAARAVGQVMATNRFPLVVPCHRVVGANGIGGFSARDGVNMKRRLLELEGVELG